MGTSDAHIAIDLVNEDSRIVVECYISDNKDLFDTLANHKEEIEAELGFKLIWDRLDGKKLYASSIGYKG